ncbi:nuclear transport factor 2 family protein [Streptomyces sp. 378]|uniref:nuclear transport factor 2 family protein n=1 Tax=Streptomyces sp. 378 TaxID=3049412 RepID=UPI0024C43858|nr:nuclear transport factor 2 family protein [Streptomyces sp. 378]MDK1345205.1 nuclear transport factor 2 family protein [Streptomyces sp. 378]
MAEHPHAALVRKGFEAFSRGDMDTLRGLMASDASHHVPGDHPLSGDFKGVDSIIEMYERLGAETNGTMRADLISICVDGRGHAVGVNRFTAERNGKRLDDTGCIIFRIVDDKVTDLDECVEDIDRSNEFWS